MRESLLHRMRRRMSRQFRSFRRLLGSRPAAPGAAELRTIIDQIPAMVAFLDRDGRYSFANRNYERWLGMAPEQMIGYSLREIVGEARYAERAPHLERALAGQTFTIEARITREGPLKNRWLSQLFMPRLDDDGAIVGVCIVSSDITDTVAAERRASFLAEHDELTALANRGAFQAAVVRALGAASRDCSQAAVIVVDVDRFKVINSTLGHTAGDRLLQALAQRLKDVVRGGDLVARLGGDEMGLLLHDVRDAPHAGQIAERVLAALREPFDLGAGIQHHATVSAGIAVYPQDGGDVDTLLRHADIAMYRAKAAGRDSVAQFGADAGQPAETRLELELELRAAIDNDELVLHFQPRVDIASGRPLGVEALVRWQHPQRGLLSPAQFIDIAEETGLIVPMGAWVLRHAGQTLRRLRQAGLTGPNGPGGLTMSVNVSACQFKNRHLVDEVAAMIAEAGCAPRQIELELTETAVMAEPVAAAQTMRRLKDLGVRLAMDDFGTGHSSLAALKRFPMDVVKIDRSFVSDIATDADDAALTRAIIAMGHSLGLHVVAEGVEHNDQLEFLRREGCDEYQGYLFARPLPEAALVALLGQTPRLALVAAS